jgi:flagellar hook assembly protein FlgD
LELKGETTLQIFGGWRGRVAALSVAGIACGALGAPAAYADAPVDPPTITTPTDGSPAAGDLTVSALAPAGATQLQFNLGGVLALVEVIDGVASTTLSTYSLANGEHLLTAVGCNVDECGAVSAEPVSVLVQNPAISAVKYSPFSPNGDRRRDTVAISYTLPAESSVRFSIRDALGGTVFETAESVRPAGTTTVVWNGKNTAGAVVGGGRYTARIDTTRSVGATALSAYATASVVVDKVAPSLTSPSGAKTRFYPYREGYRDYFQPAITTNETATLWLRVYTSGGKLIRTLSLGTKPKGRHAAAWNGRLASGKAVPAGTYLFSWMARDVSGNQRLTGKSSFTLSWQRAVLRSGSTTVTAAASRFYSLVGSCSLVRSASEVAAGALELRSNGKAQDAEPGQVVCDPSLANFDLAQTRHRVRLPVREYKSLTVKVNGSDAYGFGTGTFAVHYPNAKVATSRSVPAGLGTYSAAAVGAAAVDRYGYLRWRMTTRQGHSWAPRKFAVSFSWWVRV